MGAAKRAPGRDPGNLAASRTLARLLWLAALNAVIFLLITARWWLILRAESPRVPFLPLVAYRLAAFGPEVTFTPGPQGGEPLQVLYLQRNSRLYLCPRHLRRHYG